MEKKIFYCPTCNVTYIANSGATANCPTCKNSLVETHLTADFWATLSPAEKDSQKSCLKQSHEERARQMELQRQHAEEERRNAEMEALKKKQAMSQMLITSGFNFDGYRIVKYSGYISGDDAISVDRGMAVFGLGNNIKDRLMESLVTIRRNALRELKEAAYDLGCNAVIGVDFDYLTLDPQTANLTGGTTYQPYVFGVTANGNAVIIEKIED